MEKSYHVNPTTRKVGLCSAKIKCRFGFSENQHYSTMEEAYSSIEENSSFPEIMNKTGLFGVRNLKQINPKKYEKFNTVMKPGRANASTAGFITKEQDVIQVMERISEKYTPEEKSLIIDKTLKLWRTCGLSGRVNLEAAKKLLPDGYSVKMNFNLTRGHQHCPYCVEAGLENSNKTARGIGHHQMVIVDESKRGKASEVCRFTELDIHLLKYHDFEQQTKYAPQFENLLKINE